MFVVLADGMEWGLGRYRVFCRQIVCGGRWFMAQGNKGLRVVSSLSLLLVYFVKVSLEELSDLVLEEVGRYLLIPPLPQASSSKGLEGR